MAGNTAPDTGAGAVFVFGGGDLDPLDSGGENWHAVVTVRHAEACRAGQEFGIIGARCGMVEAAAVAGAPGSAARERRMGVAVCQMFAAIARHYDRLNTILSLGLHHRWRRQAVACSGVAAGARVLDLCSGTADLALAFARRLRGSGRVVATDFCPAMLACGVRKAARRRLPLAFALADAQGLPFGDTTFDCVAVAFGLRNVEALATALREMYRVLRPGGVAVVLEFGQPPGAVCGALYRGYARHLVPRIGAWVSGHAEAYTYLPRTAAVFPAGARFVDELARQGFTAVQAWPLSGGIVYLYRAVRPA